jgi:hypothetical protein
VSEFRGEYTKEEVENAWREIGRTPAGRIARQRLEDLVTGVCGWQAPDCALRHSEGQRSLARELILLMDAEIPGARNYSPKPVERSSEKPAERRSVGRRGNGPRPGGGDDGD